MRRTIYIVIADIGITRIRCGGVVNDVKIVRKLRGFGIPRTYPKSNGSSSTTNGERVQKEAVVAKRRGQHKHPQLLHLRGALGVDGRGTGATYHKRAPFSCTFEWIGERPFDPDDAVARRIRACPAPHDAV